MNYSVLTPPSSSEDSPQSYGYYHSPPALIINDTVVQSQHMMHQNSNVQTFGAPYLRIIEQPIDKFRFRYRSEMTGTHGSLCGQSSDRNRKQTYPTVQLCNYKKSLSVVIRCSIYQNTEEDFKPHPHRLIRRCGKDEEDDPHNVVVSAEDKFICIFHSMGIIHTAKKNLVQELVRKKTALKREQIAREEGRARELTLAESLAIKGFAEEESKSCNLNIVCLRFDAFLSRGLGVLEPICQPVYSQCINNLKSALTGELKIARLDHCTCSAKGNKEIFMLVERVTKKNIKVRFFELDDEENLVWEAYGGFSDLDVHHQYAIVFRTPPFRDVNITKPVKVFVELERPSDRARSEPKEFTYTPSQTYKPGTKRPRVTNSSSTSYDVSMASDELPLPISNLSLCGNILDPSTGPGVTSEELQQAYLNVNSEEFLKLFDEYKFEYISAESASTSVTTDAPLGANGQRTTRMPCPSLVPFADNTAFKIFKKTSSRENLVKAKQALTELRNFMKTHPSDEKAINMLHHYLQQDNMTNVLHTCIIENDKPSVLFLLKMIYVWKQYHLVNMRTEEGETPLHLAVQANLEEIVANLMMCKPDATLVDSENNTVFHSAVLNSCAMSILENLLAVDNLKEIIDYENNDGNTALNVAIETKNITALKMLCNRGADINKRHKKSGFTPLRFAVEKQDLQMVHFFLQHCDPLVDDFQGINPLHAALRKDNAALTRHIQEFMSSNDYCDVQIKNEIEDNSDEELEEKISVKDEPLTIEDLKGMYAKVDNFTPETLNKLATILDESGRWQYLVDLLDLGHLIRSGYFSNSSESPTKMLLKVAVETHGDTVWQIREFLEALDQPRAVQIIDDMVKSKFLLD